MSIQPAGQRTMPYNLMDREVQQCPYQAHSWLLENAPVYRYPAGFEGVTYLPSLLQRTIITLPVVFGNRG